VAGGLTAAEPGRVLVVNAGSSSLKLRLLDGSDTVVRAVDLPAIDGPGDAAIVADGIAEWPLPAAVGHRVVHGGTQFSAPVDVTDAIVDALASLSPLAPLHQPRSLAALGAVRAVLPDAVHVACFDTAFHATLPAAAFTYALPAAWRERWNLRRYGFHGLSHAYASRRAAELCGRPGDPTLRVVTCHLGAGASLAAVLGGRSVDTTMGFTPLEGLVMATRSGDVDPGLILWLADGRLSIADLADGLEHRSGVLGLGGSDDMRTIVADAARDPQGAGLALDVYIHRLAAGIAAMTASLGGIDILVFTGGVGEHAAVVRSRAAERIAYLGVMLDETANAAATGDADVDISASAAAVRTWVVPAREDVEIARQVRATVASA
jgi:acetate kinase